MIESFSVPFSAFGLNTPIYYMAYHVERDGLGEKVLQLQFYLGLSWILGCATFGMLVVNRESHWMSNCVPYPLHRFLLFQEALTAASPANTSARPQPQCVAFVRYALQ